MSEMRVYLANLGRYNEGELVGAWFTPPIDYDDLKEKLELNAEYEEYALHDAELPFELGEYITIEEINRMCELVEEVEGTPIYNALTEIQENWFSTLEELIEHKDDIVNYSDCETMEDVARYLVDECGILEGMSETSKQYFDYKSYGRDLEIEGNFLVTNNGVFELCN